MRADHDPEVLAPGAILFSQGEAVCGAYRVIEGKVNLTRSSGLRKLHIAERLPGDIVGEEVLVGARTRFATARSVGRSVVEPMTVKALEDAVATDSDMRAMIFESLGCQTETLADESRARPRLRRDKSDDGQDFLPDAFEIETRRTPRWMVTMPLVIVLMLAALVYWACVGNIDVAVSAQGKIEPAADTIVIRAGETAVLESLPVRPGQKIKKGDVVAILDRTAAEAELNTSLLRRDVLSTRRDRLQLELSAMAEGAKGRISEANELPDEQQALLKDKLEHFHSRVRSANEQRDRLEAEREGLELDLELAREQLSILRELEAGRQKLNANGFSAKTELLNTRNQVLSLERQVLQAKRRIETIGPQQRELTANLTAFVAEARADVAEELAKVSGELDELDELVAVQRERAQRVELRAIADAIVLEVDQGRSEGGMVQQGEPILSLVPTGVPMRAVADIASRNISQVAIGDPVKLRLEALPFVTHGELTGKITGISEDVIEPDTPGRQRQEPVYQAFIKLDPVQLKEVPPDFRLVPGMRLTANVLVGERTVISYFLEPILRWLGSAMREA
ncbi:HlyD family type I secretion periplasmic adaptor subunit [Sagittula sp. NFXS13]|uniref:HlyD family type I secretion periplasmic adaptor subunit n=1 Tax=Sagittula sp. NFXS13 TaxID=2819095 RepID=UPI0032DEB135